LLFSADDHSVADHHRSDPECSPGRSSDNGNKGLGYAHHSASFAFCTIGML
jgi:hypothetical protein